ncbi:hypothetical protein HO133_001170 [Letharia lupina]|uniref:Uncharacterized protein n=1 Tax=Letharia lupina TaxID=560253 RepID=A0A8H6CF60_9LECA|nr:uncharacterized protein HO133_001170 [Letharia lupina]KAF6222084.1 hypothetical protein HO133_001170 [Letharia lupina]
MSGDQAHGLIAPPDHRDISGEEAWARRCSLPAIAPWVPQNVKTETSLPQDALSTRLPSTLHAVEEDQQPQTSEAHSLLYSISQWQPPSNQPTGQQPSKRRTKLVSAPRTRPLSARLLASIRQNKQSSTLPQGPRPPVLPRNLGRNERIPGIYGKDLLDGRIGIRPRNKESAELRQLKSSRISCDEKGTGLSRSMKIIIQQFMVANGYICPHLHIPHWEKPVFRDSLRVRLDLHNTFITTKETRDEQRLIKSAWTSVDGYISEQSREWRAQGVFEQVPVTARPTFAAFTKGWADRNWDGSTGDFTRARKLTAMSPVMSVSTDDADKESKPTDSQIFREATRQEMVLDGDTEASVNSSCARLEPPLKRSGQDGPNNQAKKRARTRSKYEYVDHVHDEGNGLDFTRPEEKSLPTVIETIHHARAMMLDLAPMSAKNLAVMQQDWTSHGFPSLLAEMLTLGRAYTATMGKYFDNALYLMSLLEGSDHWKASHMKVEVDCACQKGGVAPEQLQNERIPDPSDPSNSQVKVRYSHEREDPIPDRSLDGKVSDRLIPLAGDIKVDRSSQAQGVAPDPLHVGIASNPPVVRTETAQVDHLDQPTAATPDQVRNEVMNPEAASKTTKNPCTL